MSLEPPVVVTFGPTATGKSADSCFFGADPNTLFIAEPGSLHVARTVCGYDIGDRVVQTKYLSHATEWIRVAADRGFSKVVVDDASIKALLQWKWIADKWGDNWGKWDELKDTITALTDTARWSGVAVYISAHVQPPRQTKTGEHYPEGPDMGWYKVVRTLPHSSDLCQKTLGYPAGVVTEQGYPVTWDTRVTAYKEPDEHRATKNRYDNLGTNAPLNTAEALRHAGYVISRGPGREWMEEWVEEIAGELLAVQATVPVVHNLAAATFEEGKKNSFPAPPPLETKGGEEEEAREEEINREQTRYNIEAPIRRAYVRRLLDQNVDPRHVRWVVRDATARARIRYYANHSLIGSL